LRPAAIPGFHRTQCLASGSIAAAVTLPGAGGGRRLGCVALVGPGGWRIDQITITRDDGVPRTVLRVRRRGYFVAEVRTIEDLVALGVDLATLIDEDAPDG
jgi:hypothetical protein